MLRQIHFHKPTTTDFITLTSDSPTPVFPREHDAGGAGPGAPVPGGGHGSDSPAAGGFSGQGQVPAAEDGVPVW